LGCPKLRLCGDVRTLFNYRPHFVGAVCSRGNCNCVRDCRPVMWYRTHSYKRAHTRIEAHAHTDNTVRRSCNCMRCMDAIIEKYFAIREKTTFLPLPGLPSDQSLPKVDREMCTRCVRGEINAGMMYYARRVCEYRPERENTVLPARFREL